MFIKESIKRWHFVICKMNVNVIIRNNCKFDIFQMFYTKAPLKPQLQIYFDSSSIILLL